MKLNFYEDTDSLYIDLSSAVSCDSKEIADGLVVGIDIQHASKRIDLTSVECIHLPIANQIA